MHKHRRAQRLEARPQRRSILGVHARDEDEGGAAAHAQALPVLRVHQQHSQRLEDLDQRRRPRSWLRMYQRQRSRHERVDRRRGAGQRSRLGGPSLHLALQRRSRVAEGGCRAAARGEEGQPHHAAAVQELLTLLILEALDARGKGTGEPDGCGVVLRGRAGHAPHDVGQVDALRRELLDRVLQRLVGRHVEVLDVLLDGLVERLL
mmetsp:Transcript_1656/g.5047  ORF Transcript_1656/g.5047 Transcript_1656/m.5047 type:complete len:206 (-) Transcript_1656:28-645(-)